MGQFLFVFVKLFSSKAYPGITIYVYVSKEIKNVYMHDTYVSIPGRNVYLSNPKPGHTTGWSGRGGAQRGGGAERSWVGRDAVGSIRPGDNPPSCPPAYREQCPERYFGHTNSLISTYNQREKKTSGQTFYNLRFVFGLSTGKAAFNDEDANL